MNLPVALSAAPLPADRFVLFGPFHLLILFSILALPFALSHLTRKQERPRLARAVAIVLATVLLLDRVFVLLWAAHEGRITRWVEALPMQLCDWASIAVMVALLSRRQLAYELAYFWGLSGTLQAILTPDLADQFPSPFFISFFVSHGLIIVSILFMTWGLGQRPRPGAVSRNWLWSQLYLVCAGAVDWMFHVNFGFLAAKPAHPSLLDFFGPWPWYILVVELVAFVLYGVLYLPFWRTAPPVAERKAPDVRN